MFGRIAIAISLFFTTALSFGPATSFAKAPLQSAPAGEQFPKSQDIIPGTLRVKLFPHDIDFAGTPIHCLSYLTGGLLAHHQREIILTLHREEGQNPGDYPRDPFNLFAGIFQFTEQGAPLELGETTILSESGFLG